MDAQLISRLTEQGLDIVPDMDLSTLSSLGTGGKAECLATPHHIGQLVALLDTAREHGIPVTVIGSLTNTLVSDEGIEGIVISTKGIRGIVIKGDLLTAYAGERLDEVINKAIGHNLSGLEELGGIPGTVGGATFGNAGANGTEISTHFFYSDYITKDGRIRRMPAYSDAFSYRHSPFTDDDIILSTAFRLIPSHPQQGQCRVAQAEGALQAAAHREGAVQVSKRRFVLPQPSSAQQRRQTDRRGGDEGLRPQGGHGLALPCELHSQCGGSHQP